MTSPDNSSSDKSSVQKLIPLEGKELPAPEFPYHCLPRVMRAYLEDNAERMQVPVDMMAIPLIVSMAGHIGKGVVIRPKAEDDWEEAPCLWGLVIARKGGMKSPCISKMTASLEVLESKFSNDYSEKYTQYKEFQQEYTVKKQAWEKRAKKDLENDPGVKLPVRPTEPIPPTRIRVVSTDSTIEKLAMMMENSPGLTLIKDEFAGLVENLSRYSNGTDRQFYLEAHSGGSGFIDRVGRDPVYIDKKYLNIIGGIQPKVAEKLFTSNGAPDDGFFERFGLLTYPKPTTNFVYVDRSPDPHAEKAIAEMCEKLSSDGLVRCITEFNSKGEPCVRLSSEAQLVFREWLKLHMLSIRAMSPSDPALGFFHKMRGLVVRLTLVFHLVKIASGEEADAGKVSPTTMEQSIQFTERYLMKMWRRVCSSFGKNELYRGAKKVVQLIKDEGLEHIKTRDIQKKAWKGMNSKKEIADVLNLLVEHNYLFPLEKVGSGSNGGRPSYRYPVNPLLLF